MSKSPIQISAFRHVALVVRNLDKMRSFYTARLGFDEIDSSRESGEYIESVVDIRGADLVWSKLKSPGGVVLELLEYKFPVPKEGASSCQPSDQPGWSHIALQTDDIEALFADWSGQGTRFKNPPALSPSGGAMVAYCHDPEGNLLEIVQILGLDPASRTVKAS